MNKKRVSSRFKDNRDMLCLRTSSLRRMLEVDDFDSIRSVVARTVQSTVDEEINREEYGITLKKTVNQGFEIRNDDDHDFLDEQAAEDVLKFLDDHQIKDASIESLEVEVTHPTLGEKINNSDMKFKHKVQEGDEKFRLFFQPRFCDKEILVNPTNVRNTDLFDMDIIDNYNRNLVKRHGFNYRSLDLVKAINSRQLTQVSRRNRSFIVDIDLEEDKIGRTHKGVILEYLASCLPSGLRWKKTFEETSKQSWEYTGNSKI